MNDLLYKTKLQNTDLKEAEIIGLFWILMNIKNLSNSSLVQLTGLPHETLKSFKSSISMFLAEPSGDEVVLNNEGVKALGELDLKNYPWSLIEFNNETLENSLSKIRADYSLEPKREYDQFFATIKTSVSKADVLAKKINLRNKSIALLGDDDLISITLGLMNQDYKEIIVFDIDPKILSTIESIAKEYNLKNIETVVYDARKEPKNQYLNRFDVVMTDPPYTKSGISLFLNRSLNFLKDSVDFSGPYIFLFYGNSFKEVGKALKVQEEIQKHNLYIEDKIDKFARYYGAESIGSASSLYVLKKNVHTNLLDDYLDNEIYTFENTYDEKFPYVDHFVFKLFNVPKSVVSSKKTLQKACGQFCNWHKLKVVDVTITKFKGGGLTMTYVLAQSNLVVHTWPEKNAIHIDLITCSPIAKKDRFAENLSLLFKTNYIEVRSIE